MNNLKPYLSVHLSTNTKSCNQIINRLSAAGSHLDVLLTYSSMLTNKTPPDAYTFPSLLKACTSLGLFSHGLSIHQHIIVHGYPSDTFSASSLVHFYSKFGDAHNARLVFDAMPERNVVPWSAIIGCYSRAGDVNMAFSMYNRMQHQGIQPNSVTVLGLLMGISKLQHLYCVHSCVIRAGFEADLLVLNSLLNLYGKCGRVDVARKLFNLMNHKDIVSWNSLISGYTHDGNVRESVELLNRMRIEGMEPGHQTFGSVVSSVANECKLELGKLVHGQIITAGFELDMHVETTLLVMYLKCGSLGDAFRLFDQITDRDVISWTAMISGLVQNDRADEALDVFYRMLKSGAIPSSTTIATALAACAQVGSLRQGKSIHGYFVRQRMQVDIAVQNSLVNMYAKCDHLEQSWVVFERMRDKDVVTWNAIVAGFAQEGNLYKAFLLFNEMRMACQRPDAITVVSLLQACASLGALHQAKWIHNFVIRNGVGPCISIDTALIDMYSKCGVIDTAQKCFDMMPEQDMVSWSTIISAYGSHGKGEKALRMYSEFLVSGIEPSHVTFLSVLSACSHAGLVSEGLEIFKSMTEEYRIEPKLEHRACIVDLLSRAGRLQEAYNFVKRMFPQPTIDVLGILLDACRTYKNADLGNIVAGEILCLKPDNAGNYVQLAHCYASMSRWDGAGEAWMQMRSLGLKKVPGWSSIELHGTIITFFVDHSSHPQYEEIVLMLKMVSREMQVTTNNIQDEKIT
ncbi:Pentatricopeptide repeat [Macleaya cordata]|uniref:Pentatricopeptide repeat n=1 Tax=Macleaya cordata TaxID=56857 RepID=A0A200QH41_MACCD|nr:Pentatricopeptide repeat [Macleaya cordata]